MTGSNFIFDSVQQVYYKCHKVNIRMGDSCIVSLDQIKKKKATISLKNTTTVALKYEEIKWSPERISKIKP